MTEARTPAQDAFQAWWKDNATRLGFHVGAQQAWAIFRDGWHANTQPPEGGSVTELTRLREVLHRIATGRLSNPSHYEQMAFDALDSKKCATDGCAEYIRKVETQCDNCKASRDWTEDFSHENGRYQCRCTGCGDLFYGHKRRVTCKQCASPEPQSLRPTEEK